MIFTRFFNLEGVGEVVLDQSAVINVLELALGKAELHNAILTASHFLVALFVLEEDRAFGKASLLVNAVLHGVIDTGTRVKVRNLLEAGILIAFDCGEVALESSFGLCTGEHGINELPSHAVLVHRAPLFYENLSILFQISRFLFVRSALSLFLIAALERHQDNDKSDEDDNVNHDEDLHFLFIHNIPLKKDVSKTI